MPMTPLGVIAGACLPGGESCARAAPALFTMTKPAASPWA